MFQQLKAMDHKGDEWMVRGRIFSGEDEPYADDYEDIEDDDILATQEPKQC